MDKSADELIASIRRTIAVQATAIPAGMMFMEMLEHQQVRIDTIISQLRALPDFPIERFFERCYFANSDYIKQDTLNEIKQRVYNNSDILDRYAMLANMTLTNDRLYDIFLHNAEQFGSLIIRYGNNLPAATYYLSIYKAIFDIIDASGSTLYNWVANDTVVSSINDDVSSLLRYKAMIIIADMASTLPETLRPFSNVRSTVAFEVTRRLADTTYPGYTKITIEKKSSIVNKFVSVPWWSVITKPLSTATVDTAVTSAKTVADVIAYLKEYEASMEPEKFGPGSQIAKETIDDPKRVAEACGQAGSYSYRALEMIAAQALASATMQQLCPIVARYPDYIVLEAGTTCTDYTLPEIIESVKQILKDLPKIELCRIINEVGGQYPQVKEEFMGKNAALSQGTVVNVQSELIGDSIEMLAAPIGARGFTSPDVLTMASVISKLFGIPVNPNMVSAYPDRIGHYTPTTLFQTRDFSDARLIIIICLEGGVEVVLIKTNVTLVRVYEGGYLALADTSISIDTISGADALILTIIV